MPSTYYGFLWRENEESMFSSSHPLADKTNNEHHFSRSKITLVVSTNHSSSGQVSVQLRNKGSDGYKKAEYGDSIIIERKITAEGGSSYKIKSTEGTVLSSLFLPLRI